MSIQWFNARLGAPMVSLGSSGLTFTPAARALLGDPEYVRIGVDKDSKRLVVQATTADDECSLEFRRRINKAGYARLSQRDIARFVRTQITSPDLRNTHRYLATLSGDVGCLSVDLTRPEGEQQRRAQPKGRRGPEQ